MSISLDVTMLYDSLPMKREDEHSRRDVRAAEDLALVAWARTGDNVAFEEIVRRYRNDVFALSMHFVRNREDAWDISQEVFVKAYRSLSHFRGDAAFKTWLLRIASNQCKDHLKRRRLPVTSFDEAIGADAPSDAPTPRKELETSELGQAIESAVAALPAKHRTAFVLREYEGLSYKEMADTMGCNVGTVMSRLHHARQKLQNTLVRMGIVEDTT